MFGALIQPWQVYAVMQADRIITMFSAASIILGTAIAIIMVSGHFMRFDKYSDEDDKRRGKELHKTGLRLCCLFAVMLSVAIFTPSTKTLAAMFILPAVTSDKVVDPVLKEGSELWRLAKKALEEKVSSNEPQQQEQSQ